MNNDYSLGFDGGASNNGSSFMSRHETRSNNMTGALPIISTADTNHYPPDAFDFEQMILSLHELFEHDRQIASQADSTRCGLCYLHFPLEELEYRDDGFYVCSACTQSLGTRKVPMLRRQQKL